MPVEIRIPTNGVRDDDPLFVRMAFAAKVLEEANGRGGGHTTDGAWSPSDLRGVANDMAERAARERAERERKVTQAIGIIRSVTTGEGIDKIAIALVDAGWSPPETKADFETPKEVDR